MADVLSRLRRPGRVGGAGLGEIEHRASERRRRCRRIVEGRTGACATRCCRPACNASVRIPISTLPTRPLYVNTELQPWTAPADGVRRAGVSAFGFGGTNFHAVLEEYIPHKLNGNGKRSHERSADTTAGGTRLHPYKVPLRGALVIGSASEAELAERLRSVQTAAEAGRAPAPAVPAECRSARAGTPGDRLRRCRRPGGQRRPRR